LTKRTTLTDIARVAGVTPTTVQRALKGIEGVGEEQRRRIQQIADEMNYQPNAMASVLKRGKLKIAAVLPDNENENRYYATWLWEGLEQFLSKNTVFQIECCKISYDRSPENHGIAMEQMLAEHGEDLDGVITMGGEDPAFLNVLARLEEKRIPYVFVGTDHPDCGRLCCIQAWNEVAGSLAADMLLNFLRLSETGRVLVTGDFSIQDQEKNAVGFEAEVKKRSGSMEILKLSNLGGIDATSRTIAKFLKADIDIAGIYSCSARNTLAICQAIESVGRYVPTIGSDVFPENIELMKAGKLQAIIHKRHYEQMYRAMQILSEYLIKNEKPSNPVEYVLPVIVMNGNVDYFAEGHDKNSSYIF